MIILATFLNIFRHIYSTHLFTYFAILREEKRCDIWNNNNIILFTYFIIQLPGTSHILLFGSDPDHATTIGLHDILFTVYIRYLYLNLLSRILITFCVFFFISLSLSYSFCSIIWPHILYTLTWKEPYN